MKRGCGNERLTRTVVRHCVEPGARAAAIPFLWGDILRPDATFAWVTPGRDAADLALEREQVHEDEGKVPAQPADDVEEMGELRERAATDAAEGGEDHG